MAGEHKFDPYTWAKSEWSEAWYVTMLQMPLIEMLSATVSELAVELILLTNETDWVARSRRQMSRGDMFFIGDACWLYIKDDQAPIFESAGLKVMDIPNGIKFKTKIVSLPCVKASFQG